MISPTHPAPKLLFWNVCLIFVLVTVLLMFTGTCHATPPQQQHRLESWRRIREVMRVLDTAGNETAAPPSNATSPPPTTAPPTVTPSPTPQMTTITPSPSPTVTTAPPTPVPPVTVIVTPAPPPPVAKAEGYFDFTILDYDADVDLALIRKVAKYLRLPDTNVVILQRVPGSSPIYTHVMVKATYPTTSPYYTSAPAAAQAVAMQSADLRTTGVIEFRASVDGKMTPAPPSPPPVSTPSPPELELSSSSRSAFYGTIATLVGLFVILLVVARALRVRRKQRRRVKLKAESPLKSKRQLQQLERALDNSRLHTEELTALSTELLTLQERLANMESFNRSVTNELAEHNAETTKATQSFLYLEDEEEQALQRRFGDGADVQSYIQRLEQQQDSILREIAQLRSRRPR
eukprot:PhM_4_TR1655/c0_g1_i1/m.42267